MFLLYTCFGKISISCPTANMANEIELQSRTGWMCGMKARVRKGGGQEGGGLRWGVLVGWRGRIRRQETERERVLLWEVSC